MGAVCLSTDDSDYLDEIDKRRREEARGGERRWVEVGGGECFMAFTLNRLLCKDCETCKLIIEEALLVVVHVPHDVLPGGYIHVVIRETSTRGQKVRPAETTTCVMDMTVASLDQFQLYWESIILPR